MANVLEKLKALDTQRAQLLDGAKAEAMKHAEAAIETLRGLGFNYSLVLDGKSARKGTRTVKDEACKICGFRTDKPHDRRAHRSQKAKKPFTEAELQKLGMRKVA